MTNPTQLFHMTHDNPQVLAFKHDTNKKIELTITQRVMIRSYSQCSANFLICPVPFSLVRVRTEGRKDKAG